MKKIVLSLIAAVILAGCSSTPETVVSPERVAIDRVFAADANFARNSTSIAQLVVKQKSLSLAGTPADFMSAYKDNIAAWQKMEAIEAKMYAVDTPRASADINRFLNNYMSNPVNAIIDLQRRWPQFSDELSAAFAAIQASRTAYINIGVRHSAAYPSGSNWF